MSSTPDPPSVPGVALVVALVIAVAAIAGVTVFYREHARVVPRASTHDARAAASAADDPPPVDQDGRLFLMLTQEGLGTSGGRETTINEAHHVCDRFSGGESEQQIVQDILAGSPGMSSQTAAAFADIAISVYCPQD